MMTEKGFATILSLIGILVIGLIIGGVYYYQIQNRQPNVSTSTQVIKSPRPSTSVDQLANWKTFENDKAGFTIQYPPDYTVKLRNDLIFAGGPVTELYSINPNQGYVIDIAVDTNKKHLSLSSPRTLFGDGLLEGYELPPNISVEQTVLGGMNAFRVNHCCGGEKGVEMEVKTIRNNMVYDIDITPDESSNSTLQDQNKIDTLNRILSTFKFLDQNQNNILNLPKDKCPCWNSVNNTCLPQSSCQ